MLLFFFLSSKISGMLDEIHELNIRLEVWRADLWICMERVPAHNVSAVKMFYIYPLHVYISTFAH